MRDQVTRLIAAKVDTSDFIHYLEVNRREHGGKFSYRVSSVIARNSLMGQYSHKLDLDSPAQMLMMHCFVNMSMFSSVSFVNGL